LKLKDGITAEDLIKASEGIGERDRGMRDMIEDGEKRPGHNLWGEDPLLKARLLITEIKGMAERHRFEHIGFEMVLRKINLWRQSDNG